MNKEKNEVLKQQEKSIFVFEEIRNEE